MSADNDPISDDILIAFFMGFIVILLIVMIFASIILTGHEESKEDAKWNNGICAMCETRWHYVDSVFGGDHHIHYIYECECGEHRMQLLELR